MKINKKIGWQKYEDLLEAQLDSPLLDLLLQKGQLPEIEDLDDQDLEEIEMEMLKSPQLMVPIDQKLMENIALTQSFDCWMAHTNFNITKDFRDKLNAAEGIEVLKICSRYRFFIGIGRMFDFTEVRKNIEKLILEEG